MYPGLSPSSNFWPTYQVPCSSVTAAFAVDADSKPRFHKQLDRDIWEQIPHGVSDVLAPHQITDTCPRHLRPKHIAKRARCTLPEAVKLADALSILDAGPRLSSEICRWAYMKGVESTLQYLHPFLVAVAEVDTEPPDHYEDVSNKKLREYLRGHGLPPAFGRHHLVAAVQRLDESLAPERSEETIGYHKLGPEPIEHDWVDSQPSWFQALIEKVRGCPSIKDLREIGKAVFASNLTGDRASVFWSFYNARKAYLERKVRVRPIAHKVVQRIAGAKHAELGALGKNLFRMQRGELKGPQLNEPEWTTIWAAYHERKQALAA
jgi:hypothetical protein